MEKEKEGIEYRKFGEVFIDWDGKSYMKGASRFCDAETGQALDTYYRSDEDGSEHYLIRNLDGSFDRD